MRGQANPVRVAVGLSVLTAVVLTLVFLAHPPLADRLTRENDVVESMQVTLFAAAAGLALATAWERRAAGASPILEVVIAGLLAGLVVGEIDLDRLIVGRKIISTRFLVDAAVPLGWRALAALGIAAPPAALGVYAVRELRALWAAAWSALAEPWGRVFLAGGLVFAFVETFERELGSAPSLPRYMLEESLELVSAIIFAVAVHAHWRDTRRRRSR
jgi:hypothetical protein